MSSDLHYLLPTLNNMGFSASYPDVIQNRFIEFASHSNGICLDVGAAFGVATIPALRERAHIIANDLDQRHLDYIYDNTPAEYRTYLRCLKGRLPGMIGIDRGSLNGILVARVLHFLTPGEVMQSLKECYELLQPNGKLFIVVTTPFIKLMESFIPVYEQRKAEGNPWPGLVENSSDHLNENANMPTFANLFDAETLSDVLLKSNFLIEDIFYFPAVSPAKWLLDGREFLGCVARKPDVAI